MGVKTHRRAWVVRAGVVVVVGAATLLGIAPPAAAAEPGVTITSLSSGTLQSGGAPATLKFSVTNNNNAPGGEKSANIQVTFTFGEISCDGNCDFTQAIDFGASAEFTATLQPGSVPPGETRNGRVRIQASFGGDSKAVERDISVRGPAAVATVPEVSGTVVDVFTGKPIEAARVFLQDSASHTYDLGTGKDGKFRFTSKPDAPIVPGTIILQVEKDGIQTFSKPIQGAAGQPLLNQRLTVTPTSSPTPSAQPSGSATASTDVSPLGEEPVAETPNEDGGGGLSWVLIAIGAVLVLLGIGAIALLFFRKSGDGDEDDEDGDGPGGPRKGGPGGGQPGRGGPRPPHPGQRRGGPPDRTTVMRGPGNDPTRIGPPPGGPRGGDQTMIARSPLADMPTQIHNRVPSDFADPTRPNPAGPPGYGPPAYGPPGAGPGYPGGPASAYPGGAPAGGPPGYGQPDPYGQAGGYGQSYGPPGHAMPPGHGAQPGHSAQHSAGYGQQPDPYAQPAQPGYGQQPDPYGQPYGQPGPAQPNYPPQDAPDPRGQRPAPPADPRGRVDWLDD